MSAVFAYVTAGSPEEADRLARTIVAERLAACANVIPGMRSVYWWEGKVSEAAETVVVFKTRSDRFEALAARVKALHSYECPCVVALPVTAGLAPYLEWIESESTPR
ncbi:MAG: divalent-cation tolerance protein CutA [Rhodospirillales bacterium]|nr:divalent-cation tolerance protein CutA [Rhodospirillales bacterium]